MRDWSYQEAKELADERYKRCAEKHDMRRVFGGAGVRCDCSWIGRSVQEWAFHVEKECGTRG